MYYFMNPHWELLRLNVCLLSALGLLVGAMVAHVPIGTPLALAFICAFIICGAGNVINDYFDIEIDKINQPKRVLASGRMLKNHALVYFIALSAAGAALSYLISIPFFIIAVTNIAILFVYSWKLKPIALAGNIAVAYLAASSFLAAGLIAGNFISLVDSVVFALAAVSFLGTLAREIIKDVEDTKGDEKHGLKTLPIILGKGKAKVMAYSILLVACISLAWPYRLLSAAYFIGMVPGVALCMLAIAKYNNPRKSQLSIKLAMYAIMFGFLLGSWL